jgi:hypothetical protein
VVGRQSCELSKQRMQQIMQAKQQQQQGVPSGGGQTEL